jgi:alkanesulfonate monooxygenase SsuD/methylene tetrahydromethanopterin reductase-like flavin-dependent oxidoreductase (luciferase family)
MGVLGFQFMSAEAAQAWVHAYYNAYTKRLEKLCDYRTNPQIALVSGFMCAETDEEAIEKSDGWTFFQFALSFYNRHGPVQPGTVNLWAEYEKWKQTPEGQRRRGTALIGSPATLRERLRRFEESHLDQVILLYQAGRNSHPDICASLELFAREVMPEFQARHPELLAWKERVLGGEIHLDEIDTAPYNFPTNQTPAAKAAGAPTRPD